MSAVMRWNGLEFTNVGFHSIPDSLWQCATGWLFSLLGQQVSIRCYFAESSSYGLITYSEGMQEKCFAHMSYLSINLKRIP